jgi:hypothetical protein
VVPIDLISKLRGALALPELYCTAFLAVFLGLLVLATSVALFAKDDTRSKRAFAIFRELVRLFRGRSR